jgi:hypothetical protein
VLDDARTGVTQVDLVEAQVTDEGIAVDIRFDGCRRGLGWILLQGRQGRLGFPGTDLE